MQPKDPRQELLETVYFDASAAPETTKRGLVVRIELGRHHVDEYRKKGNIDGVFVVVDDVGWYRALLKSEDKTAKYLAMRDALLGGKSVNDELCSIPLHEFSIEQQEEWKPIVEGMIVRTIEAGRKGKEQESA